MLEGRAYFGKNGCLEDKRPPKRCGIEESKSSDENNDKIPLKLNERMNQEDEIQEKVVSA